MRSLDSVFVDTGAWVALALTRDPLHARAVLAWHQITERHARIHTSVSVILETFTFLDKHANRDVALAWKEALGAVEDLSVLECTEAEMRDAWRYFTRRDLRKLSAVDATSFALMSSRGIECAFTFDRQFASVGLRMIG